jgi:hypothetical protein
MSCPHRFYDQLLQANSSIEYLFIGTFNPSWNAPNDNNADYFYGRATNLFWCICPHAFNENCLVDKSPTEWKEFCLKFKIGLTDIIKCVNNADQNNTDHLKYLASGFEDKNLDLKINGDYVFDLELDSSLIQQFITSKQAELKGVFFTRKTFNDIPRIWDNWIDIKNHCDKLNIYNSALPTPSARGGGVRDKIFDWRQVIQNSNTAFGRLKKLQKT